QSSRVFADNPSGGIAQFWVSQDDKKVLAIDQYYEDLREYDVAAGTWRTVGPAPQYSVSVSPDASRYTYSEYRDNDGLVLHLRHVATGNDVEVATNVSDERPNWAPDGSSLAFIQIDNDAFQLHTYDLATGVNTQRTFGVSSYQAPVFSPDGNAVAVANQGQLVIIDLLEGSSAVAYSSGWVYPVEWNKSGHIGINSDSGYVRLTPAGRVEFPGVALAAGDNVFAMSAVDLAGNAGTPSTPIVVTRAIASRPDLVIDDASVRIVPAAPLAGQPARISVTVSNLGTVAGAGSVSVFMIDPAGNATPLRNAVSVGSLAPQGRATINVDWTAANE